MGSLFSDPASAAKKAAKVQANSAKLGIEEQRRQFDETRDLLMPFINSGTGMLGNLEQGATLGGFASNLNDIMNSSALDPLRAKRMEAINAAFGKSGMLNSSSRAGAVADDLTDFSLAIEQLLSGRQQGLATMGLSGAGTLGGFGANTAGNIANLQQAAGQAQASGILGAQQARAGQIDQILGLGAGAAGGALLGGAGMMGGLGAGGGAALGLLFSDSRLKTNIEATGNIGPLTVYRWDWIPELAEMGVEIPMNTGFIAEEVERIFPEHVHPFGPFKAVDYESVLNKLDEVLH